MTPVSDDARLDEVHSRLMIAQVLTRYSRGIDRCDLAVLKSVWWPDATADYRGEATNALVWAEAALGGLSKMHRTQHMLGNMLIDLEPGADRATAETYCRAYHELGEGQDRREMVVGGRYLDVLERREGEWRILARRYIMDWNTNRPSTHQDDGFYASLDRRGARKPDDPFYTGA